MEHLGWPRLLTHISKSGGNSGLHATKIGTAATEPASQAQASKAQALRDLQIFYNTYKDKGFTVYSVSLDSKKDAWVQAIQADDLSWDSHVSELKSWYGVVNQEWNVNAIPQTFLLDKTGKIIALNAHGAELEQKVKAAL